jgi:hypothetical protein
MSYFEADPIGAPHKPCLSGPIPEKMKAQNIEPLRNEDFFEFIHLGV